jgi:hypothetical protein
MTLTVVLDRPHLRATSMIVGRFMETTILIVTRPDGAFQRVVPPVKLQKRFSDMLNRFFLT